jgi:hypothetical protein
MEIIINSGFFCFFWGGADVYMGIDFFFFSFFIFSLSIIFIIHFYDFFFDGIFLLDNFFLLLQIRMWGGV